MDWTTKSCREANHPPVDDDVTNTKAVKPGQRVELNARGSDPDDDNVYYYWWHYPDPSGLDQPVKINYESSSDAYFIVPEMTIKNIHIILEVKDDGNPVLKSYRRLIFTVETKKQPTHDIANF